MLFGPLHSQKPHTDEGSQETGDSGHYSNEESNEEMSNPPTTHSSITGSSDGGPAGAELKHSFKVETETMHHHVTSDASWPSSSSDDSLPAPHTLIAGST